MLFQAQFRGPETDAFFADMSQFTGSTSLQLFWNHFEKCAVEKLSALLRPVAAVEELS